jgi:hypothetical protein
MKAGPGGASNQGGYRCCSIETAKRTKTVVIRFSFLERRGVSLMEQRAWLATRTRPPRGHLNHVDTAWRRDRRPPPVARGVIEDATTLVVQRWQTEATAVDSLVSCWFKEVAQPSSLALIVPHRIYGVRDGQLRGDIH